jgi:hypothetical protein
MLFMDKLELSSLIDCFVKISVIRGGKGFLLGFPPFDAFLIIVSMDKDIFIYQ